MGNLGATTGENLILEVKSLNVYSPFHTALQKIYLHSGSKTCMRSWNLKINVFSVIFIKQEPIVLLLNMRSDCAFLCFEEKHITFLSTEVIKIQSSGMTL